MAKAIDSVENAAAHSHMLLEQTSNSQNIEENRQVETFNSVLILKSRWFGRTIERTYYVKIVEGTVVSADLTEKNLRIESLSHTCKHS